VSLSFGFGLEVDMHNLDEGNGFLKSIIDDVENCTTDLPYVHSTDGHGLRAITNDGQITPQPCNVFEGERLTYLFYGRPSYRPNAKTGPTTHSAMLPVCLIFKPDAQFTITRVYPFDSGAFHNAMLDSFLHPRMKLGDFALAADRSTPGKLISYFFGSNENYLDRKLMRSNPDSPDDFEVQSFIDLASARGTNSFDSRSATVEVQTSDTLNFYNMIEAVIIPSSLAGGKIKLALLAMGVEVMFYNSIDMYAPGEYSSEIASICKAYFIRKSLIRPDTV